MLWSIVYFAIMAVILDLDQIKTGFTGLVITRVKGYVHANQMNVICFMSQNVIFQRYFSRFDFLTTSAAVILDLEKNSKIFRRLFLDKLVCPCRILSKSNEWIQLPRCIIKGDHHPICRSSKNNGELHYLL